MDKVDSESCAVKREIKNMHFILLSTPPHVLRGCGCVGEHTLAKLFAIEHFERASLYLL